MPIKNLHIVDDDRIYRKTTASLLRRADLAINITSFEDGIDAIEYIEANACSVESLPDVILLDINMSFMDGWEFVRQFSTIKSKLAKVPTIFMVSSSTLESDRSRVAKLHDVRGYLLKPVRLDDFRTAFKLVLAPPQ